jgi:prepilin-type N-terminal cleavage/methylation domain-containing protein
MLATAQQKLQPVSPAQGGFTLIELLIYMAISAMVITVLTSFMVDMTKISVLVKTRKEVQENARLVLARITNDIRNAQSITAIGSTPVSTLTLQKPPDSTHASSYAATYSLSSSAIFYNDGTNARITTQNVKVDIFTVQNQSTGIPDEVTVQLAISQAGTGASAFQQYQIKLNTTAYRHGALYQ